MSDRGDGNERWGGGAPYAEATMVGQFDFGNVIGVAYRLEDGRRLSGPPMTRQVATALLDQLAAALEMEPVRVEEEP
jgi:hypothetical protein